MSVFRFTWVQNVRMAVDIEAPSADAAFDVYHDLENLDEAIFVSSEYGLLEKIEELGVGPVERIGDNAE